MTVGATRRAPSAGARAVAAFSMLEVVLALAVVAFGIVSVLALLPASMKASRESVADTHSSRVGEHLITMLATALEGAASATAWNSAILALPTAKPGSTEPTEGWVRWRAQDGITYWQPGTGSPLFRTELRGQDSDYAEFGGMCRVWRGPVTICELVDGAWQNRTLPAAAAVALNLEVSWPVQVPYERRQKALYALNVFYKGQ